MKNGEILRGPPSSSASCSRSMVVNPPMPEPMNTPTFGAFSGVIGSFESSIANCDAAMAYWMKTSIFLTSFFSMNCSGSKPLTSAAICAANPLTSNLVIAPTPLVPASSAFQFALGADAERRHQADAGDDDPPAQHDLRGIRRLPLLALACASM